MKKTLITLSILGIFTTSCVKEEDQYNKDHDRPYEVSAGSLLTNAQKELSDQMTTPSVNLNVFRYFSQYWAATQYTTESRYRVKTRTIPDNHWSALYRDVLNNLEGAKNAVNQENRPLSESASDWTIRQKNKLAIIEIQEIYTFQILVDSFGDIPYSEALNPSIVLPKYDNDQTIYPDLINRLNQAIGNLDDSGNSFDSGDYIYNGEVSSWRLFANSLKMKLGINLSDVNNSLAKSTIESAFADGVITSNTDNALFHYDQAAPNYNPVYANLVASGRNDFVPASTIVDAMNTLNDPRRANYFTMNGGDYIGGDYGYANAYSSYSHMSDQIKTPNAPGVLMEATEVNFLLAEAAERGFNVGGSGETYYNTAIQNSFEFWGRTNAEALAYLSNPDVAYATAAGTWKEKIGKQAWIALFNRGFESWTTWRRLDAPLLEAPASAYPEADGVVPKRLTYPINEQTVNGANYSAASIAIGNDRLATKIFWDVN